MGLTFGIPPAAPATLCRSCKAKIVWIVTEAGKRMPVNVTTDVHGRREPRGESHFATCPNAEDWRKSR